MPYFLERMVLLFLVWGVSQKVNKPIRGHHQNSAWRNLHALGLKRNY